MEAPIAMTSAQRLKIKQAAEDLERDGYAVISGVFSRDEAEALETEAWATLDKATGGELRRDRDYSRVLAKDLLPHKHGIVESFRFNHSPWVRKIRRDPRVVGIFAALYGTDQLVASMDRVNFKLPGKPYHSTKPWPHIDQNPRLLGRITIQSYLCLTDCGESAPGNRLYRGSHAVFESRFAYLRSDQSVENWQTLTETEASELEKVCPLVKPVLHKGDMLLWDSRTVHSPSDGTDFEDGRIVVYLCYNKLWEKAGDSKFRQKKKDAFVECRSTRHSPNPQHLFGKGPRTYGAEKAKYYEFSKEQLGITDEPIGAESYLFGFESYNGREGLLLGPDWKTEWRADEAGRLPLLTFTSPYTPLLPPHKTEKKKKNVTSDKDGPAKKKKKV